MMVSFLVTVSLLYWAFVTMGHLVSLLRVQPGRTYVQLGPAPSSNWPITESFWAAPPSSRQNAPCHSTPQNFAPVVQLRPFGYEAIIVTECYRCLSMVGWPDGDVTSSIVGCCVTRILYSFSLARYLMSIELFMTNWLAIKLAKVPSAK